MVLGSVIVGACLLVLGWAKEIVALFVADKDTAKTCTIGLAIMSIYVLDFAINAGMWSSLFVSSTCYFCVNLLNT